MGESLFSEGLSRWQREPMLAFEEFLATYRFGRRALRPSSYTIYRGMFERLLAWCLAEGVPLWSLTEDDLQRFLDNRSGSGGAAPLGRVSRHRYLLFFRALFDHWRTLGRMEPTPEALSAEPPRDNPALRLLTSVAAPERDAPEFLTLAESERLIEALLDQLRHPVHARWKLQRNPAMLLVVLGTGLRVGELIALRWEQVVRDEANATSWQVRVPEHPPYPARDIEQPHHFACEALSRWREVHQAARLAPTLVFPANRTGAPLSAATVFRQAKAALQACGIHRRYEGPTLLRNSCAARWLAQGKPVLTVMQWMGHRQLRSTEVLDPRPRHQGAKGPGGVNDVPFG